jgi:hypothetical protein
MTTDSYSNLWGPVKFGTDAQMPNAAVIMDHVDCDFLTMEIEVPSSASPSNASFGLNLSLDDPRRNSLSTMSVMSDCDYSSPRSPVPKNQRSFDYSNEVSPDLPGLTELQMQYQDTLKKLAKSMRRSDATRSVIKRQRKVTPSLSFESDNAKDFFASPNLQQLEQSRNDFLFLINGEE